MLNFNCVICSKQLEEPGAIIFGPPEKKELSATVMVKKHHVCAKCYREKILTLISENSEEPEE